MSRYFARAAIEANPRKFLLCSDRIGTESLKYPFRVTVAHTLGIFRGPCKLTDNPRRSVFESRNLVGLRVEDPRPSHEPGPPNTRIICASLNDEMHLRVIT